MFKNNDFKTFDNSRLFKVTMVILVFVLLSNFYVIRLISQKDNVTTIIVPSVDRELIVGSQFVSDEYLLLRAEQIIQFLFNIRYENANDNMVRILKQVASPHKIKFKEKLETFVSDIRAKKYFYIFNKENIEIDNKNLTVSIKGNLETFISDKLITSVSRTYQLSFTNNYGLVSLTDFVEVKDVQE